MRNVYALNEDIIVSEHPLHASIHLTDVKEEFEKRLKLKNSPHLLLVKLHGMSVFGDDAQQFIKSDEEASLTKAVAVLCDSESGYFEHGRMLVDVFLWFANLKFPSQLFDSESEALAWLEAQYH